MNFAMLLLNIRLMELWGCQLGDYGCSGTPFQAGVLVRTQSSDFSEIQFRPELIKKHGWNWNSVVFKVIEYQVYLLNNMNQTDLIVQQKLLSLTYINSKKQSGVK